MNVVAEETWTHPRVLIVTEGHCVSVYVDGAVTIKHVDRPVCKTTAGNDRADELLAERIGPMWKGLRFRAMFWTSSRTLAERVFDDALVEKA